MKEIPLSQGKVALVDDIDYAWLSQWSWYFNPCGRGYAQRSVYINGKHSGTLFMHRCILDAPKGTDVDHVDGNTLNNCRSNIRLATRVENCQNSLKRARTTSQFKGVSWRKDRQIWRANIQYQGDLINLGHFHNELDAARAYDEAARLYFGEFAKTNF